MEIYSKGTLIFCIFFFIGFNVCHRRRKQGKVGFQHRLGKEDAMKWFQTKVSILLITIYIFST